MKRRTPRPGTAFGSRWACAASGLAAMAVPAMATGNGSLLVFANVEIKWDSAGEVIQDTMLTVANAYPSPVNLKMFFVNGDPPVDAVFDPVTRQMERAHPGWTKSGCSITLRPQETRFWSALTGQPGACPFTALDGGSPAGRPDPDNPGWRTLRGFVYVWAVSNLGTEINWNYLTGDATIVNYRDAAAWAYAPHAFRALLGSRGELLPEPGVLRCDGNEYDAAPDELVFSFSAPGMPPSETSPAVFADTDLTLLPLSQDLRQDNDGPVITKARFHITNSNGVTFSGTERCISCWDQRFLSHPVIPNHFLHRNLGTEFGSARIDGIASPVVCGLDSEPAALIGVAARIIAYTVADANTNGIVDLADYPPLASCMASSGPDHAPASDGCRDMFDVDTDNDVDLQDYQQYVVSFANQRSYSTVSLVGTGTQEAVIRYDVPR